MKEAVATSKNGKDVKRRGKEAGAVTGAGDCGDDDGDGCGGEVKRPILEPRNLICKSTSSSLTSPSSFDSRSAASSPRGRGLGGRQTSYLSSSSSPRSEEEEGAERRLSRSDRGGYEPLSTLDRSSRPSCSPCLLAHEGENESEGSRHAYVLRRRSDSTGGENSRQGAEFLVGHPENSTDGVTLLASPSKSEPPHAVHASAIPPTQRQQGQHHPQKQQPNIRQYQKQPRPAPHREPSPPPQSLSPSPPHVVDAATDNGPSLARATATVSPSRVSTADAAAAVASSAATGGTNVGTVQVVRPCPVKKAYPVASAFAGAAGGAGGGAAAAAKTATATPRPLQARASVAFAPDPTTAPAAERRRRQQQQQRQEKDDDDDGGDNEPPASPSSTTEPQRPHQQQAQRQTRAGAEEISSPQRRRAQQLLRHQQAQQLQLLHQAQLQQKQLQQQREAAAARAEEQRQREAERRRREAQCAFPALTPAQAAAQAQAQARAAASAGVAGAGREANVEYHPPNMGSRQQMAADGAAVTGQHMSNGGSKAGRQAAMGATGAVPPAPAYRSATPHQQHPHQHQPHMHRGGTVAAGNAARTSARVATAGGGAGVGIPEDGAAAAAAAAPPTLLFERLVSEEVQELKAYARIIESQNRRLNELERVHEDLEARLERETSQRVELEATLEAREMEWAARCDMLERERDQWKQTVEDERGKNERLLDLIYRKDKEIHRMIQRKYDSAKNLTQQHGLGHSHSHRSDSKRNLSEKAGQDRFGSDRSLVPDRHKSPHEILAQSGNVEAVRERNITNSLLDFFGM